MGVDGVDCRRRTEELVDDWAHDAGIVAKDEHVNGRAGLRSSAEAWETRNHGTKGEAAHHVGVELAKELAPEVVDHALFEGGGKAALRFGLSHAAGLGLGAGVAAGSVLTAHQLYSEWAHAHQKGDDLRSLAQNDAVNVALSRTLSFHPAFGNDEAARRPGVEKGTGKLLEQLHGKDAALVPIMQARADEGFVAAERAFGATRHLAGSPERAGAMRAWMKDNGFEDRQRNDIAFGKGVEYFGWLEGVGAQRGADVAAESKKVHDRQTPAQAFACRG